MRSVAKLYASLTLQDLAEPVGIIIATSGEVQVMRKSEKEKRSRKTSTEVARKPKKIRTYHPSKLRGHMSCQRGRTGEARWEWRFFWLHP